MHHPLLLIEADGMLGNVRRFFTPVVETGHDLTTYVLRTSAACTTLALAIDMANQLSFFQSWPIAIRSWIITILVSASISIIAARTYGRAQLDLFTTKTELETLSRTDPLTGLLNRRALTSYASKRLQTLSLVIVDIDRFKQVNDAHGHLAGDDVIVAVSALLQRHLGPYGDIARLGGEEFACLSRDIDPALLIGELDMFRRTVATTPVLVARGAVTITVSAGIAAARDGESFETLYGLADRALYRAKSEGRNRIVVDDSLGWTPKAEALRNDTDMPQGIAA